MFGVIGNYIAKVIRWGVETTLRFFKDYFGAAWALLIAVLTFIWEMLDYPIRMINWIIARLNSINVPDFNFAIPGGAADIFALANTFFPLDEFVRYFVVYCIIYIVMTVVRLIKMFLPTIHGWGFPG